MCAFFPAVGATIAGAASISKVALSAPRERARAAQRPHPRPLEQREGGVGEGREGGGMK